MLVNVRDLVDADLYPDEESVIRDALRLLLRADPKCAWSWPSAATRQKRIYPSPGPRALPA